MKTKKAKFVDEYGNCYCDLETAVDFSESCRRGSGNTMPGPSVYRLKRGKRGERVYSGPGNFDPND